MVLTSFKMPRKNDKNNHFKISLNNIIKRLPLHQQLNNSHAAIIDFSQTWQDWVSSNLTGNFEKLATLSSFDNGLLTVRCISPTAASQLKHLQISLLEAFHAAGFTQIQRLKIQIDHTTRLTSESDTHHQTVIKQIDKPSINRTQSLKKETLKGIKNCGKRVKNERLMTSLQRLASTLEKVQDSDETDT